MPRIDVHIPTNDGVSNAALHVPEGAGPWPGVLVFTDIFGTRDAFLSIGERLAGLGYVALIPDVYYRGDVLGAVRYADGVQRRERAEPALRPHVHPDQRAGDRHAGAYADFLLARPEVRGAAIGAHGYGMGGRRPFSRRAASETSSRRPPRSTRRWSPFPTTRTARTRPRARSAPPCSWRAPSRTPGSPRSTPTCSTACDRGLGADTVEIWPGRHGFAVPDQLVYDEALVRAALGALQALYAKQLDLSCELGVIALYD